MAIILVLPGCTASSVYEVDLSQVEGFEWDGRLRIVRSGDEQRITLRSADGRLAVIDPRAQPGPTAELELDGATAETLAVTGGPLWQHDALQATYVIYDPASLRGLAAAVADHDQGDRVLVVAPLSGAALERPPAGPDADLDLGKLTFAQLWAMTIHDADDVQATFFFRRTNTRVELRGECDRYGPAALTAIDAQGNVLATFSRTPLKVQTVRPGQTE
jgi:hypothetical protein